MRLDRPFVLLVLSSSAVVVAACVADEPSSIVGDNDSGAGQTDGGGGTNGDGSTSSSDGSVTGDGGGPGVDAGPPNFCATQSAPDGSADFFCADFDESDPYAGLTDAAAENSDAATLLPTNAFYKTKPTSMEAMIPLTTGGYEVAQRGFIAAGPTTLKTIHVSAQINPPSRGATSIHPDGLLDLLAITLPLDSVEITFGWSSNASVDDASTYEGYVIRYHRIHTFGFAKTIAVPPITDAVWTNVDLSLDLETGNISLAYNGAVVIPPLAFFAETTTSGTGLFGGATYGDTLGGTYHYDNFQVWTTRVP